MFWSPTNIVSFRRDLVHILQEEGWAPGQVCKISPKTWIRYQDISALSNYYTDWAIPACIRIQLLFEFGFVFYIVS